MQQDNLVLIDVCLPKEKLLIFLGNYINDLLKNYDINADGYVVKLAILTNESMGISALQKTVRFKLPLAFNFEKFAGLFTVSGGGEIEAMLEIKWDISKDLVFSATTNLIGHEWIKTPTVKLGSLDIPIETLSNWVLRKLDDEITTGMDAAINNAVSLPDQLRNLIKQTGVNYLIMSDPALFANVDIATIQCWAVTEDAENIMLKLAVESTVSISDKKQVLSDFRLPDFEWKDVVMQEWVQKMDVSVSYRVLETMIQQFLEGREIGGKTFVVDRIKISQSDKLSVDIDITEPIKAKLQIEGVPEFSSDSGVLTVSDLNVDVTAKSIIYKLTSPIIERLIRGKIEEILPFNIHDVIQTEKQKKLPFQTSVPPLEVVVNAGDLNLLEMRPEEDNVEMIFLIKNVSIVLSL
ncbi:MAG: DUF4403 family protein [Saprospiraceae bacterium]|nr:DUF4403 family protein [Saprospiraceae bacterium]